MNPHLARTTSKGERQISCKRRPQLTLHDPCMCCLRLAGSLPGAELAMFRNASKKTLMDTLKRKNEALKKFKGVNKKALDQSVHRPLSTLPDRWVQSDRLATSSGHGILTAPLLLYGSRIVG